MYNRENGDHSPPIPTGFEQLGKELEALKWLQSSLGLTQRLSSSKRKDSLVLVLTKLLDGPNLDSYDDLLMKLEASSEKVNIREQELETLNTKFSELQDQYPGIRSLIETIPELTDYDGNLRYRLILKPVWKKLIIFTTITTIVAAVLLAKVLHIL